MSQCSKNTQLLILYSFQKKKNMISLSEKILVEKDKNNNNGWIWGIG